MRPLLALATLAVTLAACGGTSSETPWPVEPESRPLGPSGETAPVAAEVPSATPDRPPDAGAPRAKPRQPEPDVEP